MLRRATSKQFFVSFHAEIQSTVLCSHKSGPFARCAQSTSTTWKPEVKSTDANFVVKGKRSEEEVRKIEEQLRKLEDEAEEEEEDMSHWKNPTTGEVGGPRGPEPTRYGDWERSGRVSDF